MVPSIKNATDIFLKFGEILNYQNTFEKIVTYWEKSNWNLEKLLAVTIDISQIDRLYHIYINQSISNTEYEIIARMKYDKPLYVKLTANTSFDIKGKGCIFFSNFRFLFISEFITYDYIKECILNDTANV